MVEDGGVSVFSQGIERESGCGEEGKQEEERGEKKELVRTWEEGGSRVALSGNILKGTLEG